MNNIMLKLPPFAVLILCLAVTPAFAGVVVSSPANNATVGSPVRYAATATTNTCARGVAAMGVYVNNQLYYSVNGTSLNTAIALAPGSYRTVVIEWDYCGGALTTPVNITVANSGVFVDAPANNSTVNALPTYSASAQTSCAKGIGAMGIYVDNALVYTTPGATLQTAVNLPEGTHRTVVQAWDNCGGSFATPVNVTVQGSAETFTNLQATHGWNSWGQLAPLDLDCDAPCQGVSFGMQQGVTSPSMSGNATQFSLSGTTPYSDVLFELPLIGQFSTQGMPDPNENELPLLHTFTYDTWFYLTNANATQAEEFDVNWFMGGVGMTWGHQCNPLGDGQWDIWDNARGQWVSTGAPCTMTLGWNHVTINVQRDENNQLLYHSIVLNGTVYNINRSYPPFTVPDSWYGITVNYQMDGNAHQEANTTYLDNFNFRYW